MILEEQGEVTEGCRQEAEDTPPGSAGEKEQMKHESVQERNPGAGGDDSQDTDCSTCARSQQEPEQPGRQLACLEVPDFLRSDAAEGSTGEVVKKKYNNFGQSCFALMMKQRSSVCVWADMSVKEGKKAKKRKKNKHTKKHQVPAEMATEPELAKYWAQRYRLFSRFDQGIKLDRGWDLRCQPGPGPGPGHGPGHALTFFLAVCFRGLVLGDSGEDCRAHRSQGRPELLPRSAGHRRLLRCRRKRHPVRTDWEKR